MRLVDALVLGGAALVVAGAYYVEGQPWRRRRRAVVARNPWVTLRNRRRVFLDDDGRIEKGLPETFRGVHVRDVPKLSRRVRAIEREGAAEERSIARRRARETFKHDEAVAALLEANPHLVDFLEAECSHDCGAYRAWVRRGRRGPKPKWSPGDGRFDAVNERLEKRSAGRKVASWLEAVYVTPPPSRRWDDFPDRVAALEEATGLRLNMPAPVEDLAERTDAAAAVRYAVDQRIGAIVELARTGRLADGAGGEVVGPELEEEDAPF